MAKLRIKAGATEQSVLIFILDSSQTDGRGLAGLTSASYTGSQVRYARPGETPADITLAVQTVTGAYTSGGFVEVDGTNMPGVYRFDIPNAAIALGALSTVISFQGATNAAPLLLELQLDDTSPIADAAGPPPIDADIVDMIKWGFTLQRNEIRQTASQQSLRNDANTADVATSTTSDSAGTFTRGEWQ